MGILRNQEMSKRALYITIVMILYFGTLAVFGISVHDYRKENCESLGGEYQMWLAMCVNPKLHNSIGEDK